MIPVIFYFIFEDIICLLVYQFLLKASFLLPLPNLHRILDYKHLVAFFFQTVMIFFDQFKVPSIKFGKCFAEFMKPIALLKKFGS